LDDVIAGAESSMVAVTIIGRTHSLIVSVPITNESSLKEEREKEKPAVKTKTAIKEKQTINGKQ
jgi:hypothetical protein